MGQGRGSDGGAGGPLWAGPWPAEDGGPTREQMFTGAGWAPQPVGALRLGATRDALATTMVLLRGPGEVFVLRHSLGRRPFSDPVTVWIEQVDPHSLAVLARSPELPAGPFWPGGMAILADGGFVIVMGVYCHRLDAGLAPLVSRRLPGERPYNSLVVLADGTLVMKEFAEDLAVSATLHTLDPDTLEPRGAPVEVGESAIARLSADGEHVYVVGTRTAMRFGWDGTRLSRDLGWSVPYLRAGAGYGWDPVLSGGHCWFLDNGRHAYTTTMRGAGIDPGPVHLWRISLSDCEDREHSAVSERTRGAVTNPPLVDPVRRIAVAHDAANGVVQAFAFSAGAGLQPLWRRRVSHAAHALLRPETGEAVLHDFRGPALWRTRLGAVLARRGAGLLTSSRFRAFARRFSADEVIVVDIETGIERARVAVPTPMQSVVFPAPGFDGDLYWVTMATIARLSSTGPGPRIAE